MRNVPRDLADLRARMVKLLVYAYGFKPDVAFTCDTCKDKAVCQSVYDGYNTNGDCIESK
jgi:predicted dithiol-disulfide oxidoreductase (DUF899 family)